MKHYPKNPRQITKKEFADLRDSLRKFGDLSGIVHNLNTDEVISGNQRMEIFDLNRAQIEIVNRLDQPDEQGTVATGWVVWEGKRYTYRAVMWDERQAAEANIRANKAGGSWDFDTLANEFEIPDLLEWGFSEKELQLGGFDLNQPEGDDPGAQMDKAEELRQKWGVESGQLWRLGEHRLICGDCTDRAVVERVMGGEKAGAVVTDPPYGINLDTQMSSRPGRKGNWEYAPKHYDKVIGDDKDYDPTPIFEQWGYCPEIFLFGADYFAELIPERKQGSWLVWDKRATIEDIEWSTSEFELCWSKAKHHRKIARITWSGILGTEQEHDHATGRKHPTQKPTKLAEWILEQWSKEDEIIVDPYCGSGFTLIACERLHRKCRAVEISPAYCAVAIQRWVDMTGGAPELLQHDT